MSLLICAQATVGVLFYTVYIVVTCAACRECVMTIGKKKIPVILPMVLAENLHEIPFVEQSFVENIK